MSNSKLNINRLLMFTLIIFILIIGLIGTVYADDMLNDYKLTKKSANEWRKEFRNYGYGSNLWTINTFLDDALYDYSKDFWMPIEPWEYMVCSRGLSTQLINEDGVIAAGGGIYGGVESITVAAYRRVPSSNDTFLYEITWYVQPSGIGEHAGYYYNIDAIGESSSYVIQPKKEAYEITGESGYNAFYSSINYTKIVLKFLDEERTYPIIEVKDASR